VQPNWTPTVLYSAVSVLSLSAALGVIFITCALRTTEECVRNVHRAADRRG